MAQDLDKLRGERAGHEEKLRELMAKKGEEQKKLDGLTAEKDKLYSSWSSTRDSIEASRIEMKFMALSRQISSTQEGIKDLDMKITGIGSTIKSLTKAIEDRESLQRSKWQVESLDKK
jgi:chromosome segregation ATPase